VVTDSNQNEKSQELHVPLTCQLPIPVLHSHTNHPKMSAAQTHTVEEMFTKDNKSLLKKHLTQEIFDKLQEVSTKTSKFTLEKAIKTCVDNQDSGCGIYAGDEESYTELSDIFDKVIEDYHGGYTKDKVHKSDMDYKKLTVPEFNFDDYVVSTRIRVGRNIRGYGLSPGITKEHREEVEKLVTTALKELKGDLKGTYYPLEGMDEETRVKLVEDHFLFKKGDRFLEAAGANRDWPHSRGIFHNDAKTFLVWVNEEDQMRIISMQKGGDFKEVFERLTRAIKEIEESIKKTANKEFQFNDHHGYIHSCPTNLGTGMRASVHVRLPKLSATPNFEKTCAELNLQPRGIHGEHSETTDGVYDISNKHRIGRTEVELVQTMVDGVKKLIEIERSL